MTYISSLLASTAGPNATGPDDTSFRQLRHLTKNALQRILCQVAQCRDLQATADGRRLVEDLERRVLLSAQVSDALFGFTGALGGLALRLRRMARATMDLLSTPEQALVLDVVMDAPCPPALEGAVVRIAHELVGNAVKHGMHARSSGRVTIRLAPAAGGLRLLVVDDGWGPPAAPADAAAGEGLHLARALAAVHGGSVTLARRHGETVATVLLRT